MAERAESLLEISEKARAKELPTALSLMDLRKQIKKNLEARHPDIQAGNALYALRDEDAFENEDAMDRVIKQYKTTAKEIAEVVEDAIKYTDKLIEELVVKAESGKAREGDDNEYKRLLIYVERLENEKKVLKKFKPKETETEKKEEAKTDTTAATKATK